MNDLSTLAKRTKPSHWYAQDPHRETLADRLEAVIPRIHDQLEEAAEERQYTNPAFLLARALASHRDLWQDPHVMHYDDSNRVPSYRAIPIIEAALVQMGEHNGLSDVLAAEDSFFNAIDPDLDFCRYWDGEITTPTDMDLPGRAWQISARAEIALDELAHSVYNGYRRWLSWVRCMQILAGEVPIFLSTDTVIERIGCVRSTVSNYRAMARRAGFIVTTKSHVPHQRAEEFKVAVDRLLVSSEAAELEV